MKAVVSGMIAAYPLGGVAWDYGQYVVGLQRLGFEVTYLEDSGFEPYDPRIRDSAVDGGYGVAFLQEVWNQLTPGNEPAWHYRSPSGSTFGISPAELLQRISEADVFLNVSNSALLRSEYLHARHKVMIDTDPGWNQLVALPKWDRGQGWPGVPGYRAHDSFFSYAEAIGQQSCSLPTLGIEWHPTRPPLVDGYWSGQGEGSAWTTVMNWESYPLSIEHEGRSYGGKSRELSRVIALPRMVNAKLELALDGKAPDGLLESNGWSVVPARAVSSKPDAYRDCIQRSRGEFSVAKNVYVATGSGWFSCRSVCYLASGRPVVLQDTGFSAFISTGEGLLSWSDIDDARSALERVEADYETHSRAARALAVEEFAAEKVLGDLLDRAGLG